MEKGTKLYFSLGIILATFVALVFYFTYEKMTNLVPVVVATQTIEPRTQISPNAIKIEKVPNLGRHELAFEDTSLIVGGYSTGKIYPGQQIIRPMVGGKEDSIAGSGISSAIQGEMLRAITLPADAAMTMGGKLKKGDVVDIIAVLDKSEFGETVAKTIIQQVEIFDIAQKDGNKEEGFVTLVLRPEENEILLFAQKAGKLYFSLNSNNAKSITTTGVKSEIFCAKYGFQCQTSKK